MNIQFEQAFKGKGGRWQLDGDPLDCGFGFKVIMVCWNSYDTAVENEGTRNMK